MNRRPRPMGHNHPALRHKSVARRRLRDADFLPPPEAVEVAYEAAAVLGRQHTVIEVLVDTGKFPSKTKARDACRQGRVQLNGTVERDGDLAVAWHDEIRVDGELLFGGGS